MTWLQKVLNTQKHINVLFMPALIMARVSFMGGQMKILTLLSGSELKNTSVMASGCYLQ